MSFQKQVHIAMRTPAKIAAEEKGKIVVYPCATKTDTECFPCIAVEVFKDGKKPQKTWVDLRKLGQHFDSLESAMTAAKQVLVINVSDDGEVQWEIKPEDKQQ